MKFLSQVMLSVLVLLSLAACGPAASAAPAPTAAVTGAAPASSPTSTQARLQSSGSVTLRVFAAASLYESFNAIDKTFESSHPGVNVELNFGGSQQLVSQISEGAPADVFASADRAQMDAAIKSGRVAAGSEQIFAGNHLVVAVPQANPANIASLKDLARPGLHLVLAAKEVPVGQYSLDFLKKASQDPEYGSGYQEAVLKNVVSYENSVKSVLNKVSLGEADAGIVYFSDALDGQSSVRALQIPDKLNVPVYYLVAPLTDSPHPDAAKAFIDYLLSDDVQATFVRFGFVAVR